GPKDINKFVSELKVISSQLELEVILCPIGKAPGHEDDQMLKIIASFEPNFQYISPESVYDIMFLIANASLYVGTSLHGMITAQSFGVPFTCLNEKLAKVSSYLKTWIDDTMECIKYTELTQIQLIYESWD